MPVFPNLANLLAGYLLKSVATTKGDLFVATAAGVITRLPAGTNGHVLKANSGVANGLAYAAEAGGGTDVAYTAYDPSRVVVEDDFVSGSSGSGSIGVLGWSNTNGPTLTHLASVANHPGIVQMGTTATINTVAALHMRSGATTGVFDPTASWDLTFVVRVNPAAADKDSRHGLMDQPASSPPANGIYFECLAADTNWFAVCRYNGTTTDRNDTGVAYGATNWLKLRLANVSSQLKWQINGGTLTNYAALAGQIPTAIVQATSQVKTLAAVNQTWDIDYFGFQRSGVTR